MCVCLGGGSWQPGCRRLCQEVGLCAYAVSSVSLSSAPLLLHLLHCLAGGFLFSSSLLAVLELELLAPSKGQTLVGGGHCSLAL